MHFNAMIKFDFITSHRGSIDERGFWSVFSHELMSRPFSGLLLWGKNKSAHQQHIADNNWEEAFEYRTMILGEDYKHYLLVKDLTVFSYL